jgi:hypothetical protein
MVSPGRRPEQQLDQVVVVERWAPRGVVVRGERGFELQEADREHRAEYHHREITDEDDEQQLRVRPSAHLPDIRFSAPDSVGR